MSNRKPGNPWKSPAVRIRSGHKKINSIDGNAVSSVSVLNSECQPSKDVTVHLKHHETNPNERYKLDAFFDLEDNNISQIFGKEVSPFIPQILEDYNLTIFPYAARGSGKTYTMQGSENLASLMPLAMYIHLKGLAQVAKRKVAHTGTNDVSTRSHVLVTVYVSTPTCHHTRNVITGKFSLIDLAGNKDNRRTCNTGIRLQESTKINQSLFALSNVIYALNNNQPRIPYTESKLTRLLQDTVGGTRRASMVACLFSSQVKTDIQFSCLSTKSKYSKGQNRHGSKTSTVATI
ncbi:hypothetical protein KY285_027797 [Solanum tuberosum]|nr:hypothetical protein KY285_027797 [Solanum tuberosum]